MTFGIDVGFILVPFWSFFMFFLDRFVDDFKIVFVYFMRFLNRKSYRVRPPSPRFLHTGESYQSKTHGCDFKDFAKFKKSLKVFLHMCDSCQAKTNKCTETRKHKQECRGALDSEKS